MSRAIKNKISLLLFSILILGTPGASGQEKIETISHTVWDTTIQKPLLDSTAFENDKTVILYENDTFIISTPLKQLTSLLSYELEGKIANIKAKNNLREIALYLVIASRPEQVVDARKIASFLNEDDLPRSFAYSLLDNAHCLVYNKKIKQNGKSIVLYEHVETEITNSNIDGKITMRLIDHSYCIDDEPIEDLSRL